MHLPTLITEGVRIVYSGLRRKTLGHRRYPGTAEEICEQIVHACFDRERRYFMTSPKTYPEFWARDFGRAAPALMSLGFEEEVWETYRYAFQCYEDHGRFALVITPGKRLFDFPRYAPDGFAFFLFGLCQLKDRRMVEKHVDFLNREAKRFYEIVINDRTGLARQRVHFSEAQDFVIRNSSCYTNSICFLTQRCLDELGLNNPLSCYDYPRLIRENFFAGDFFYNDMNYGDYVSGDAAILPFWCGVFSGEPEEKQIFDRVLQKLDKEGINSPLPSRYGNSHKKTTRTLIIENFNKWQRDTVWTCLGIHLLEVLRMYGHERYAIELEAYRKMISLYNCFPEVIDAKKNRLYSGPLYQSEDSMLWAANVWQMLREQEKITVFKSAVPSKSDSRLKN